MHKFRKLRKITLPETGEVKTLPGTVLWDKTEVSSLFSEPPEQNSIIGCRFETINSTTPLPSRDEHLPLEFRIPSTDEMIDPAHFWLRCHFKIVKLGDGGTAVNLGATEYVAPINFFLNTQFRYVECSMNNVNMSVNPNFHYPYLSYLFGLLHYTDKEKKSFLSQALYFPDTKLSFDSVGGTVVGTKTSFSNEGFSSRLEAVTDSTAPNKEIEMFGPIQMEIFKHSKLLLNGVSMFFRFHRADPKFSLMTESTGNYKIEITRAELQIKRVTVAPVRLQKLEATLKTKTASYNYVRYDTKIFPLAKNTTHANINIWAGLLPSRVYVIHLSAAAHEGNYALNPFNFTFHNLKSYSFLYNSVPVNGLTHTVAKPSGTNFYIHNLLQMNGFAGGQYMSRGDMYGGYGIIMQDLTPDLAAGAIHNSKRKEGNLDLKLTYDPALTENIMLFVVGEIEDSYVISQDRAVVASTDMKR